MRFVNYYGLETPRGEFVQAPGLEQSLIRCDGPFQTLRCSYYGREGLADLQIGVA